MTLITEIDVGKASTRSVIALRMTKWKTGNGQVSGCNKYGNRRGNALKMSENLTLTITTKGLCPCSFSPLHDFFPFYPHYIFASPILASPITHFASLHYIQRSWPRLGALPHIAIAIMAKGMASLLCGLGKKNSSGRQQVHRPPLTPCALLPKTKVLLL